MVKAFDSVDHKYLLEVLKAYNFPDAYIKWVKVIYNNLEASVLVNGYTTAKFKIEQSVKQGDALSCALFVLAIEPLLRKIQKNEKIEPITIADNSSGTPITHEIKKAGFADDITCFTNNVSSLQEIVDEYGKFSSRSGIKLNVKKTEILVIGKNTGSNRVFNIEHSGKTYIIPEQTNVKICGITFSNDKEIAYENNVVERIQKLEKQLNIWRQRNLTLEGKILIAKTFGLSQLIFAMQSTIIKQVDLKRIDDIIFRFIWNIKSDSYRVAGKIKRQIMVSSVENAGLNAPDVFAIDKAIKYKALLNINKLNHPLKVFYKNLLTNMGFDYVNYTCRIGLNTFLGKSAAAHCETFKFMTSSIFQM